jgi:hypothetical protein
VVAALNKSSRNGVKVFRGHPRDFLDYLDHYLALHALIGNVVDVHGRFIQPDKRI